MVGRLPEVRPARRAALTFPNWDSLGYSQGLPLNAGDPCFMLAVIWRGAILAGKDKWTARRFPKGV